MSCVNIDGKRNIQVAEDGRLLKNMTRRLYPQVDDDGDAYIMVRSRKDPSKEEKRYLKVLVFEHHSGIAGVMRAKLDKDDVDIVDADKGIHVSNLRLTDAGLDKVEGQRSKAEVRDENEVKVEVGPSPEPRSKGDFRTEPPLPDPVDTGEEDPVAMDVRPEELDVEDVKGEVENEVEVEPEGDEPQPGAQKVLLAEPTTNGGHHYNLLDESGGNVNDTYNEGKTVNGEKNLQAIEDQHNVDITVAD